MQMVTALVAQHASAFVAKDKAHAATQDASATKHADMEAQQASAIAAKEATALIITKETGTPLASRDYPRRSLFSEAFSCSPPLYYRHWHMPAPLPLP